jgi:uncharacterized membrane protein YoaK (UPF0700 family)
MARANIQERRSGPWLLERAERRSPRADLGLGVSTALVAGLVNVCGLIMFFAFSANVTGHAATLAEELVKGHWYQAWVVLAWMGMFLLGAFLANLLVTRLADRSVLLGHAGPVLLQVVVLALVAHYGEHHYAETLWESELLISGLLLSMGLQNGTAASVSNSVVRTTHLTGLFTDLAMELSQLLRASARADAKLRFKFRLHAAILVAYLSGGLAGGLLCRWLEFRALHVGCGLLLSLVLRDLGVLWLARSRNRAGAGSTRRDMTQGVELG